MMIKIGDIIRLRPSAFENEFELYNWMDKYLYEDRFKYVSLRFMNLGQPGDQATTLFGSSDTIIRDIEYDLEGAPFIIWTDHFRIIYPPALIEKEITVLSFAEQNFRFIHSEKSLIDDLEFFEQDYLNGLFNVMEREHNKIKAYEYGLYKMIKEGKWEDRINQST